MLYPVLKVVLGVLFRLLFRFRVTGAGNMPAGKPVILIANHSSYLDPVLLGVASPRRLTFMAKEELFRFPPFAWLIHSLGAFPIRRGGVDRGALRGAAAILEAGGALVVFPEGGRHSEELGKGERGTALLARKTGATIVPAGIIGANRVKPKGKLLPRFPRVEVRIGPAMSVPGDAGKESMEAAMDEAMSSIARLLKEPAG